MCLFTLQLSNKTKSEDEEEGNINQKQEMITCVFTLLGEAWPESRSTQGTDTCHSVLHAFFKILNQEV